MKTENILKNLIADLGKISKGIQTNIQVWTTMNTNRHSNSFEKHAENRLRLLVSKIVCFCIAKLYGISTIMFILKSNALADLLPIIKNMVLVKKKWITKVGTHH